MAKYFLATPLRNLRFLTGLAIVFLFGVLLMPSSVFAAYNTVQFTEGAQVYLEGIPLTLVISSGGNVAGMTVYSTYVSFSMESGSSVTLTSSDRKTLTNTAGVSTNCLEGYSQITLTSTQTETITVTPSDTCGGGGGGGGGAAPPTDTTAPSISNIQLTIADTTTTITWQTSEASLTWIFYGTSTAYGSEQKSTVYNTSHSITLENLTPQTTYHYQIKSKDSSGNTGAYTDQTFITLALGETPVVEVEGEEGEEEEEEEVVVKKPISEMTVEELKAEILRISKLITELQAELAQLFGEGVIEGVPATFTFQKNLYFDMVDTDVKYLQIVLNSSTDTKLADSGVGSPGKETNYFGLLTKSAVIKFQEKYSDSILAPLGFSQGTGYVGNNTREKLNKLLGK